MFAENKRAWLLGIFMECPYGEALENCPAWGIRKLSVDDRVKIAEGVNPEVLDRLLKRHHLCLTDRQGTA